MHMKTHPHHQDGHGHPKAHHALEAHRKAMDGKAGRIREMPTSMHTSRDTKDVHPGIKGY